MSEKFRVSLWEDGVENDVFFEDCWEEVEAVLDGADDYLVEEFDMMSGCFEPVELGGRVEEWF